MIERLRTDFHIHTHHLGCANETMVVADIVAESARAGVSAIGFADHINRPEQIDLHTKIRGDMAALESPPIDIYFGVELNYTGCDEEFVYGEEIRDRLGFQYAIGGIHSTYLEEYDLNELVDIQHRHHLKTCEDPLVDVLVHPYWFGKWAFDEKGWPWFDSMRPVPESYRRELGQASNETGTAIEINATGNIVNGDYSQAYVIEYIEFLATLAEEGARFSFASDAHAIGQLETVAATWRVADQLRLRPEQIWMPDGAPFRAARS